MPVRSSGKSKSKLVTPHSPPSIPIPRFVRRRVDEGSSSGASGSHSKVPSGFREVFDVDNDVTEFQELSN